jgi:hypothetical protein
LRYGAPDILLIIFPNIERKICWVDNKFKLKNKKTEIELNTNLSDDQKQYFEDLYSACLTYMQLSLFCKILKIKLLFSTYDSVDSLGIKTLFNFPEFISINNSNDFMKYAQTLTEYEKREDLFIRRDNSHRGVAFHKFWAKRFIDKLEDDGIIYKEEK